MTGAKLPDKASRTTALTDINHSFLVEAGAGSGKTSIMAGRVAVLFAQGVKPKNVAAITFTEFAASELRIRIERFVNELSVGTISPDLESAFPQEVPAEQRANLAQAKTALDELVCTTIHGFAQALIKPYPAEAGIDPGAEIIDPAEGDLAFDERFTPPTRKSFPSCRKSYRVRGSMPKKRSVTAASAQLLPASFGP
jgi:exodeoxyribonuclease-5